MFCILYMCRVFPSRMAVCIYIYIYIYMYTCIHMDTLRLLPAAGQRARQVPTRLLLSMECTGSVLLWAKRGCTGPDANHATRCLQASRCSRMYGKCGSIRSILSIIRSKCLRCSQYTYIHIYTYTHIYIYTYTYIYIYTCIHNYTYIRIYI